MKILVTGGAGFIGSHLIDELVRLRYRVIVVDDLSAGHRKNINKRAKFYKIDISRPQLSQVFRREKPYFVFHFAAQKNVRKSVEDPIFDARVNIIGSLNVLENCHKYGVKKVVFSSTGGAIYGDTKQIPTLESHLELPVSPYGITKLAVDKYLHYYHTVFRLKYVSLRLANIYGPRQDPEGEAGVVAIFMDRILKNKQPFINGHGKQTRDYVYIGDVVRSNVISLKNNIQGVYNIGTAKEVSVNKLFSIIKKIARTKFSEKHRKALPGEQMRSCLSYRKFKNLTGWSPQVSLEKGLGLTYQWFKKRYEKN